MSNRFRKIAGFFSCLLFIMQSVPSLMAKDKLIPIDAIKLQAPRYFIISIGINQYKDEFWSPLKWAQADARKIADQIGKDTGYLVEKHLVLDEQATLRNIMNRLTEIRKEVQKQDIVVLYISSHGSLGLNPDGELGKFAIVHDTRREDLPKTGLSHDSLKKWMESLNSSRNLMIFASCHSGVGKSRLSPEIRDLLAQRKGQITPLTDVSEGLIILSAAAQGEAARESSSLQGDIYTHFLLEALDTYDRNQDGLVTALEAHDYAQEKAWFYSQGQQRANFEARSIGKSDVALKGQSRKRGLPVLKGYQDQYKDFSVMVNEGVKGRLPMAFPLQPKTNIVKVFSPGSDKPLAVYAVDAEAGESIDFKQLLQPQPFELRLDAAYASWQDAAFQKLTGDKQILGWTFAAHWHYQEWTWGLAHQPPLTAEGRIRPELQSRATWDQTQVLLARSFALSPNFTWEPGIGLGQQHFAIKLKDQFGNQMDFKKDAMLVSAEIRLTWRSPGMFTWSAFQKYAEASWDFGRIGDLSGRRWETGLSVGWYFGGKARRIE